jgi:hypothetical protein
MYRKYCEGLKIMSYCLCIKYRKQLNVELQFELVDFCTMKFVFCRQIPVLNIYLDDL